MDSRYFGEGLCIFFKNYMELSMNIIKRISIFIFSISLCCFIFPSYAMKRDVFQEKNHVEKVSFDPFSLSESTTYCNHTGPWKVQDKKKNTVIIEGEVISKNSNIIYSDKDLKTVALMCANSIQGTHVELTKSYPLAWLYFKIRELYKWESDKDRLYGLYTKKILQKNNTSPYCIFTVSEFSSDGDKKLLGCILLRIIYKNNTYESVELDTIVVNPKAQGRGLSTILISSIFKLLPKTKRIFLDVLCTNKKAIGIYESFGFIKYENNNEELNIFMSKILSYSFDYEYLTDKCSKFQKVAATFREIKG